jgi:hypothetical protein
MTAAAAPEAWRGVDTAASNWLLGLAVPEAVSRAARSAVLAGDRSASLRALATGPLSMTEDVFLSLVFAAYRERAGQLPLRAEAIDTAFASLLARMLSGAITPEAAATKLWSLADRQSEAQDRDYLDEFRGMAMALDLYEDPNCEFELDLDEWRAEMLALARSAVAGIPLEEHHERQARAGVSG